MREIKFRAWSPVENKFFYADVMHGFSSSGSHLLIDLSTISQFTGLLDKQGVEIYEGDLLRPYYDDTEICEVIWNEEDCSFRVATYLDNLHGGPYAELFFMDDIHDEMNEVIGNIYENKDLLC